MKQSSSQTLTHDKCRCDRLRLQRSCQGGPSQIRRPTIPSGKNRPDRKTDHRKNRQERTTRSNSVGRYRERGSRIRELQHHHGPKVQQGQSKSGNQRDIGKSLRTVLPKRRNNEHPKMGRSRQPNLAGSYQHQHGAGDKEKEKKTLPRSQGHGSTRISSSVGCIRKRRKNQSTTPPTRY